MANVMLKLQIRVSDLFQGRELEDALETFFDYARAGEEITGQARLVARRIQATGADIEGFSLREKCSTKDAA